MSLNCETEQKIENKPKLCSKMYSWTEQSESCVFIRT